jgi:uncharacterized protein (TIGR02246 family)
MRNAAFAAVLFLLAGCSQPAPFTPVPDLKSQIDANNLAWAAAANRADPIAVAYLYTETATMLPPGMDMQRGRAAIQRTIAAMGGTGITNFVLTALDVAQVGPDTAREIGRFSADVPGPNKQLVKVEGKYVVIWKLVGGRWLLDVDIWNLNK